jgi:hypothetical protein
VKHRRPPKYHAIEFAADRWVNAQRPLRQPLTPIRLRAGTPIRARIKPYVLEGGEGPIEVADLYFEDGAAARGVPFACFCFSDEP